METRDFERSKWFAIAVVSALTIMLLVGAFQTLAAPPGAPLEAPPERPPAALYAVTWNTTVITEATNASSSLSQNYAYQDVACEVDVHNNQRLTITLQASLDDSDWFQTHAFSAIVTDTTVTTGIFTRTLSVGRYERMAFAVMTAYAITPTCKSVFFNNWMPLTSGSVGGIQ